MQIAPEIAAENGIAAAGEEVELRIAPRQKAAEARLYIVEGQPQ